MPKDHHPNSTNTTNNTTTMMTTGKNDFVPSENGSNHVTTSDIDSTTNSNETTTKRTSNTNGKFSIQKMIRQGFSSWRTRKKPPPPPVSTPSSSNMSTHVSAPPSPPSSTGHFRTADNDTSEVRPSTTLRTVSTNSTSNSTVPQRIIVTEQIAPASNRPNSVDNVTLDFDRSSSNTRVYIQSPWANASSSTTMTTNESKSRPEPVSITRVLPTSGNFPTTTTEMMHHVTSTSSLSKIPPPGMYSFMRCNIKIYRSAIFFFSCP